MLTYTHEDTPMSKSRQALPERSKKLITTGRMIQFALMGSTLIYGLVVNVIEMKGKPEVSDPEGMQMIFSILGIGACFVASLVNRALLKPERLGDPNDLDQMNRKIFAGFIIAWAIGESCAVFGFALAFILKDASIYLTFGLLSFLTILAYPITEGRLRALMK